MTNGERLKKWRLARGLSLSELAKQTGVGRRQLGRYEEGTNVPNVAAAVALFHYTAGVVLVEEWLTPDERARL